MPARVAVTIGINYSPAPSGGAGEAATRAGLNPLRYAEADATDLAAALTADGYMVTLLLGAAATRQAIIRAIQGAARTLAKILRDEDREPGPADLLVVHFAGHGQVDPDNPDLAYLVPADGDPADLAVTAIPLEDLAGRHLGRVPTALALLDCCHSGYAVGRRAGAVPDDGREFAQQADRTFRRYGGRVVFTACAGDERAREDVNLGHGVFTHYVLRWWRDGADGDQHSLANYVGKALAREGVAPPVFGGSPVAGLIPLRTVAPPAAPAAAPPPTTRQTPARLSREQRRQLRERLAAVVAGPAQFRDLCFDLGIPHKTLDWSDLPAQLESLILEVEERGLIADLAQLVDELHRAREAARQEALHEYNRAIELDPQDALAYCNRGMAYERQGQFEQARADYSRAIELDPHLALAYMNRGVAYERQGQYEQARADYSRAIELDPQYAAAYCGRGLTYERQGQNEQARTDYSRAIELDPQYAVAYNNRGNTYYNQKRYIEAIVDYSRAIDLDPQYIVAHVNRGNTYDDQKRYAEALADYNRAIDLDPHLALAYMNRGITYHNQKRYAEALADYNRAIEIDPQYAAAYNNRGITYRKMARTQEADADAARARQLDPSLG